MDRAWSGRCQANAELTRVLGVPRGHEGSRFLVTHRDEADLILALAQGLDDRVDAIPDDAEDKLNIPSDQRLNENVRGGQFWIGGGEALGLRRVRSLCRARGGTETRRPHQPDAQRAGRLQYAPTGVQPIELVSHCRLLRPALI